MQTIGQTKSLHKNKIVHIANCKPVILGTVGHSEITVCWHFNWRPEHLRTFTGGRFCSRTVWICCVLEFLYIYIHTYKHTYMGQNDQDWYYAEKCNFFSTLKLKCTNLKRSLINSKKHLNLSVLSMGPTPSSLGWLALFYYLN